jgi:hypothetical protein
MKQFFLAIVFFIAIKAYTQISNQPQTQSVKLSPAAKIIFKDVKTKLSNEEKNFFSEGFYVQKQDKNNITNDKSGEDMGVMNVEIYPTDLNKDGTEEIFMRTSGTFYGQWLPDLTLYIKDKNGKYVLQKDVSSPRLYTRTSGFGGYPDLVGGLPEGPGFEEPKGNIVTYRWDGTKYKIYNKKQAQETETSIDEVVSPEYVKTIPANVMEKNTAVSKQNKIAIPATPDFNENKAVALTPMAAMLFNNVKTRLSNAEKNDLIQKTGITPADTLAKTKKGKPKTEFTIYPTDLNKDGTEEIFLCVTTSTLGIPSKNYFFYAKDHSGSYQPLPGKIGQGVKIILNNKAGYPDLINGIPGLARQVFTWDGRGYRLQQTLASSINLQYKTMDIDKASMQYTTR